MDTHPTAPIAHHDLIIGVDGGATSTVALVAECASGFVQGRGLAGPSNIQAVGVEAAIRELDLAVARAFVSAKLARAPVASACLGLAGVDRDEGLDVILGWADAARLATRVSVSNDARLLFAAGTPDGWGLAVIAGTGSIAFTLDPHGQDGRAGGWGYLLGDEGSAFRMGLEGLRAACRTADGIAPTTRLLGDYLLALGSDEPRDFIPAIYRGLWDKAAVAALAPIVLSAAESGDPTASAIVECETRELARTADAAVRKAGFNPQQVPVALAGGLLLKSDLFREQFLAHLENCGVVPSSIAQVDDPARGAIVLARAAAGGK